MKCLVNMPTSFSPSLISRLSSKEIWASHVCADVGKLRGIFHKTRAGRQPHAGARDSLLSTEHPDAGKYPSG